MYRLCWFDLGAFGRCWGAPVPASWRRLAGRLAGRRQRRRVWEIIAEILLEGVKQ